MSSAVPQFRADRVTIRRTEAACRYGVSKWFIDRLITEGHLRATKVGRVVLIDLDHAEQVLGGREGHR